MEETISVRVGKEEVDALEELSEQERSTRSVILRQVLRIGIQQKRLEFAIKEFQQRRATAWKASRLAGIPLTQFLDILGEKGIEFPYTIEELREDMKDLL